MTRTSIVFVCSECGEDTPKWAGQCPSCKAWNTLREMNLAPGRTSNRTRNGTQSRQTDPNAPDPTPITAVQEDETSQRRELAISEVNRVLGGGLVPGSLTLVGGEPGVGKSTLLLQIAHDVARGHGQVLYATGEESAQQVHMRCARLETLHEGILLQAENDVGAVLDAIDRIRPTLAIVDSIQTVYDPDLEGTPGSIVQVKESAGRLMRAAKSSGVPVILVGHVNKEGAIAGPRVLEHLVDTVLYLEGERGQDLRILRATKNRFGSTDEVGIFSMGQRGLEEVTDPSAILVHAARPPVVGSVIVPALQGARPMLLELQTLLSTASPGLPRRTVTGVELNRLLMVVAVLEQRARTPLGTFDIFVNVVGGLRLVEPAGDLALALSLASNVRHTPLTGGTLAIGELGLAGEIRPVTQLARRLSEGARLGFSRALVPVTTRSQAVSGTDLPSFPGLEVIPVSDLDEAIRAAFGPAGPRPGRGKVVPFRDARAPSEAREARAPIVTVPSGTLDEPSQWDQRTRGEPT